MEYTLIINPFINETLVYPARPIPCFIVLERGLAEYAIDMHMKPNNGNINGPLMWKMLYRINQIRAAKNDEYEFS